MSAPTVRERLIGKFIYFIPVGSVVDTLTISHLVKPDGSPTTNWTDFFVGTVLSAKHEVETEDNSFKKPSASGGWEKVRRIKVISDAIRIKTREMGEPELRLEHGLAAPIVLGEAQTPFVTTDRRIEGWFKAHDREEGGVDLSIMDHWASMEIVNGLSADGKTTEPEILYTMIKTVNGVAVAGNTIVFPAVA